MSKRTGGQSEENEIPLESQQSQSKEDGLKADGYLDEEDEDEDDDTYRLRVYGYSGDSEDSSSSATTTKNTLQLSREFVRNINCNKRSRSVRRFSKRLSKQLSRSMDRRRSSIKESLPDTPQGWVVFLSAVASAILAYEVRLQFSLTKPPATFCQLPSGSYVEKIYEQLTGKASSSLVGGKGKDSRITNILSKPIQPSLFVGTRGMIASTAAYLQGGPSSSRQNFVRFREIFIMSQDGAQVAVDWEFKGAQKQTANVEGEKNASKSEVNTSQQEILNGIIRRPVVIILHGINNDSSFGYMKSLSSSFCNRGYVSASVNFRGCGGHRLKTPRGYNAAYTGDLRSLVRQISVRLAENVSIFIVGNSLGANIMTKYLGEEGMAGTLPSCVSGGASLGNPLLIDSKIVRFPFNVLMALGVKKIYLENWKAVRALNDARSKEIHKKGFLAPTIAALDNAVAPALIRNNPMYPFEAKIGYETGEEYWFDASSYRYIRHISVPFLNITAEDDFIVSKPSRNKLGFCLANPNVMNVETRCGGHLGWQEAPPDGLFGGSSWADTATSDFFDAILNIKRESSSGKGIARSNKTRIESDFGRSASLPLRREKIDNELKDLQREAIAFTKEKISRL
ncbi:unnamed protein product [Pseudo-nitzschia multistriata]|uniref:AB hydrolase-1 domain-containing protein n=1 Tax=Pseudo-nitzschia multistriata TaxID=183589 RepID=A0A448Z7C2_9STRA|nr:unnamed protein product [Pseudo-nitzschia multistriata]